MYKVLISDPLPPEAKQILEATGQIEVIEQSDNLEQILGDMDGWIVRSGTQVTAQLQEHATKLKGICRAGAGIDNIELEPATRRGIVVMNTPGSNARAAAEHAVALLFSLARNIPFAHSVMSGGGWGRKKFVGTQLLGKRIGVVGMGQVGREVVKMAKGLGMTIDVVDPFLTEEAAKEMGAELKTFEEMIPTADHITLHVPLTDKTRGLLNAESLKRCKKGVLIANCSRGGVVDEAALLTALESGHIAGAALDVYSEEPPPEDSPLRNHPNLVLTPHLGASTVEAQEQVSIASGEQIRDLLMDGTVANAVNAASLAGEERKKYATLADLAFRIGCMQSRLLEGKLKTFTVEIENQENIELLQRLAVDQALAGFLSGSSKGSANSVNARLLASELGIEVNVKTRAATEDWTRWLKVEVSGSEGTRTLEGAAVGRDSLRLVRFDGYPIDAPLDGPLLITECMDKPGMAGRLGSLLGELELNIAHMSLGRIRPGEAAVSIFHLDSAPSDQQLEAIRKLEGLKWVSSVPLEC